MVTWETKGGVEINRMGGEMPVATDDIQHDDEDLQTVVELLQDKLCLTGNLDVAKNHARRNKWPEPLIDAAIQVLIKSGSIFDNLEPAPIAAEHSRWYYGPPAHSPCWNAYTHRLATSDWTETMLGSLDRTTSRAIDLLDAPGSASYSTRGLVIGRVQSGKTAHFTGVVAKAADTGYRLFIILSGITNSLRLQTQKRLHKDLANPENPSAWNWLTRQDIFGDFEYQNETNANLAVATTGNHRSIAVVKKQRNVLRKLIDWLQCANETLRRDCPVLIIDDEADQASLNVGKTMEREELTRINSLIIELLGVFNRCGYVGYTATPFANVLTDPEFPENLYPKDFMFPLTPPSDYFGAEKLHGRQRISPDEPDEATDGLPLIRGVEDKELSLLRPSGNKLGNFNFGRTPSLTQSLRYFLMATAARLYREDKGSASMHCSTMLVHTSQRILVHRQAATVIKGMLEDSRKEIKGNRLAAWESQWASEMACIDREKLSAKLGEVEFGDLLPYLHRAADRCKVIVSNSMKDEETNVTFEDPRQIAIVIGGNTLARGLTLEGLVVSFFVRSANAYDTILQMGRWFGYRPYYEDLPRIWMTNEMRQHFFELATIEEELREQLEDYRALGLTPTQAALKIRRLPNIRITAANKMRFAVTAEIGYGGRRQQTIHFDSDETWLKRNHEVARQFIGRLGPGKEEKGRFVWKGREPDDVLDFIKTYQFHRKSRELDPDLLSKYIRKQNSNGGLLKWNVVLYGRSAGDPALGRFDCGNGISVNCINRAKLKDWGANEEKIIYIKALMAPMDILADMPDLDMSDCKNLKARDLYKRRGDDNTGLLIIYPISKNSKPGNESDTRTVLGVREDIVGVALVFPEGIGHGGDADYVQAKLNPLESEMSSETEDEDALDTDDASVSLGGP
jgi:hypothetical protein